MGGNKNSLKIFTGRATRNLTQKICDSLDVDLGQSSCPVFADGEFEPCYEETIRGSHVFIVQSTPPPAENLLELLLMIDAAKRASAYKIIAVIPYFGYARQDRKDKPRVSIGAKLMADLLSTAGIDRVITMDLHADQIQGFFNVPVDHLYASALFVPFIEKMGLENVVVASPDVGGTKRANTYAKMLETDMVICHKTRARANEIRDMTVIGDPLVNPLNTPLSISGRSASFRGVVPCFPLLLLERSASKSSCFSGMPGGQPSITTPIAGPCDSPNSDTLYICPKEFISKIL